MAWISVHEQVIGGKLRSLAKEIGCSQNEALGLLVRLWLWGINNADKAGRIIGAEKYDIAEVLTIGIDGRYSPENVVDALISTRWIDIDDGLYIHDWEEWQEQWYKAIGIRERDAARKREERRRKRIGLTPPEAETQSFEKDMEEILPSTPPKNPHEDEQKGNQVVVYVKNFEDFWSVYPRKVGKGDAYKKYNARINDGWSPAELLEAAKNYADFCKRKKIEKEFVKHPKTFLSETTPFIDFLPKDTPQESADVDNDDRNPFKKG